MRKLFKKRKFDIEACIAGSFEGMQMVNQNHQKNWRLGQEQSWKVDELNGRIIFAFADGAKVSAPVQVIGTYQVRDSNFLWAWHHPVIPPSLSQHTTKVKAFGQTHACDELIQPQSRCTEKRAWEYTALAMLLAEANGAYRVQIAPDTYAFMTFGEVRVEAAANTGK